MKDGLSRADQRDTAVAPAASSEGTATDGDIQADGET